MRFYNIILIGFLMLLSLSLAAQDNISVEKDSSDARNIAPVFTTNLDQLDDENDNQDVSGLLQSSRDVFTNIAGFNFSAARYRMRGYSSEEYTVLMNGVVLNEVERGRAIWAFWGGLNDITRYQNTKVGVTSSAFNFSGIGGYSNIDARASSLRKGSRFSYSLANRSYRNRVMFTHNTGMMSNGWAFSVSGSVRWSEEGYVEGTSFSGASYFLSAEKKINAKHSIGAVLYGAPTAQGVSSITTQETYDLTGNNFYNAYWGYQNGEKRNSRIRNNHLPRLIASHYFTISDKTSLKTSAHVSYGKTGYTRLGWQNAADPRPEYYKNLPSYYNDPEFSAEYDYYYDAWTSNNTDVTQVNWDQLYFANSKNLSTIENVNGIEGNNVTGNRSKYIVENQRQNIIHSGFNSVLQHQLTDNASLNVGLRSSFYKSNNFQVVEDLLGGDFWLDIDGFAERDFPEGDKKQTDIDNPNQIVKEGDRFGYDYDIHNNNHNLYAQIEGSTAKVDWYFVANFARYTYWRTGNVRNGLFPEKSFGESEKTNFNNYGLKAGAIYKLTGRHLFGANLYQATRAPFTRTVFLSPINRADVVPDIKNEKISSGDLNYYLRYPKIKARATVFYTTIEDKTIARNLYFEEANAFGNYILSGVDLLFTGVELGVEANVTSTLVATAAYSKGSYVYNSRPNLTVTQDNNSELLVEDDVIHMKNFRLGGMPQEAASFGLKYNSPKYWYVGANINWFDDIYLDASAEQRSARAFENYVSTDPNVEPIFNQKVVDSDYTLNLFLGKSWKINENYIRFNVNINNVLNNKDFQTGGFEQLRFDPSNPYKFPPRVGYMYGTTFFAMLTYLF